MKFSDLPSTIKKFYRADQVLKVTVTKGGFNVYLKSGIMVSWVRENRFWMAYAN